MTTRPSRNETPPVTRLDHGWWAPALALHERVTTGVPAPTTEPSPTAQRRLAAWRATFGGGDGLAQRLAAVGLDERGLLTLLDETPTGLAARLPRPRWAGTAEDALLAAAPAEPAAPGDWRAAFAVPLRPFVDTAAGRLLASAGRVLDAGQADLDAITAGFAGRLGGQLLRLATRTLVAEYNQHRPGLTAFAMRMSEPAALAALLTTYPVLARLLGQVTDFAVDAAVELLDRFAADREAIVATLLGGRDPGALTAVATGLGDAHRHGRAVAVLSFADGRRVVYKPRDLAVQERFDAMVDWLNAAAPRLSLRTAATLYRSGYGWAEHVEDRPLADRAGADRFYLRQGALLALLHSLHATDIHCENLIACDDQPVLVDAETLFHPALHRSGTGDPAANALASSVLRTGLLPTIVVGDGGTMDVSGLGGDHGGAAPNTAVDWELTAGGELRMTRRAVPFQGARNRPRLAGVEVNANDHQQALLDGFRLGYDTIMRDRAAFTGLVRTCADVEVRVVVRHTQGYATLLAETTHPHLLRDGLDREQALDVLWTTSRHDPMRSRLAPYEQACLWDHDIPVFSTRPDSVDLRASDGLRLPDVVEEPGLDTALGVIAAMTEVERRDQEWVLSASMATRRAPAGHEDGPAVPGPLAGVAAPPERLLLTACALADQIVARGMSDGERVNWLGLEFVDDRQWMVLPMGAGLAGGYTGVALFLAQLGRITGVARYLDVARRALTGIPGMLDALAGRPAAVTAVGCGGLHGFGGVAYALARCATLLDDEDVLRWCRAVVDLAADATGAAAGVATGRAGCLAAMSAVHAETGMARAARLAGEHADTLTELVLAGRLTGLPTGFTDGTSGIGWALARFAETSGEPRHADAAETVLEALPANPGGYGWCSGVAGLAVARAALPADPMRAGANTHVVRMLANRPVLRDLNLCHGEFGIAEALTVLSARTPHDATAPTRRRRVGLILDTINRFGTACGVPGEVPTPGLLTGIAGIGYGLLRLGFAGQVPSVLLFEPTTIRN